MLLATDDGFLLPKSPLHESDSPLCHYGYLTGNGVTVGGHVSRIRWEMEEEACDCDWTVDTYMPGKCIKYKPSRRLLMG